MTQGPLAGQGLTVFPWQAEFIRGAFAPDVTDAGLSVARGNGKTSILAGIALATVEGPLMQPRAETVIVAASFEQAGILFDTALAYGAGRVTGMHYRILNSQNRKLIEHLPSGANAPRRNASCQGSTAKPCPASGPCVTRSVSR